MEQSYSYKALAYRYCLKHHWQAAHQKTKDKESEFNKIPIFYTKGEQSNLLV